MSSAAEIRTLREATWKAPLGDPTMLGVSLILLLVGFMMILSASAPSAEFRLSDSLFFFKKQVLSGILGLAVMGVGTVVAVEKLRILSKPMLLGSAVCLAMTYMPHVGVEKLGASRWIKLGPWSLQPSEIAKLALVLYLADVLSKKPEKGWTLADMRHALLPVGGMLGLVLFQPDLGTTLILAGTAAAMFLCAGTSPLVLGLWGALGAGGAWVSIMHNPYQADRLLAFLNPWAHARGIGFQIIQSLLAIGSGGIFGTGWGQGKQKLFYLPIQHTDFIFSVLAEEMGLIGSVAVVALFCVFAIRGLAIARGARTTHAQLVAVGLTCGITLQAFLNMAVVTASVPTTGVPLPFLSFGGTSLLVTLFSVGLLLAISRSRPTS